MSKMPNTSKEIWDKRIIELLEERMKLEKKLGIYDKNDKIYDSIPGFSDKRKERLKKRN